MAYSFTEKKRIRKDFGKLPGILERPLSPFDSDRFLSEVPATRSREHRARRDGIARGVSQRVPDRELLGQRGARVRELSPRRSRLRREGVPAARPHVCRAAARARAADDLRQGSPGPEEEGQGHPRARGLSRRNAADDRPRHVRDQRHRARDRVAAAPLAWRVLRPRQGQDAFVGQAAVLRARDSLSRLVARLRVRPEGLCVRPHRPPPQAAGQHHSSRARLHERADPRPLLRAERVQARRSGHAQARARAPARRDGELRHQDRPQGRGRERPPDHDEARPRARAGEGQGARGSDGLPRGQDPRARRRRHVERRADRERERRDHKADHARSCSRPASRRSRRCS